MTDKQSKLEDGAVNRYFRSNGDSSTYAEVGALAGLGVYATASFMPSAAAYTAGYIMDTPKEFLWKFSHSDEPVPPGSLLRVLSSTLKIGIAAVPAGQTSYTLRHYSRTPPSALANNALWLPKTVDLSYRRKPIALGTPVLEVAAGDFIIADATDLNADIRLEMASSSSWGQLITDGGHTAAAVARDAILFGILL